MSRTFPDYCYKGAALGSLDLRNTVLRLDEIQASVPADRSECYTTIARFTQEYRDRREKEGSVQGFDGACMVDVFWIDVDDADLDTSLVSTLTLLTSLFTFFGVDERDVRVYFSGKKGFHVGVLTRTFGLEPSPLAPQALGLLARRVSEQAGVPIDRSIYKANSLLRLPNSVNAKSGLFKIPLAAAELGSLTIPQIQDMATAPAEMALESSGVENELLVRLWRECLQEAGEQRTKRLELPVLNSAVGVPMPRWGKVCIYRMMKGVPNGHRNEVALRLAVHFRQQGMPLGMAAAAMLDWNRRNEEPLEAVDVEDVTRRAYESEYDYGCHDPILDRYCHRDCYLYPKKYPDGGDGHESAILSIDEARDRYLAYIRDREKAKVSWGIPWLDRMTRQIAPGQVGCIMARAGVGKTALVINTVRVNSANGVTSLFCSLEQLAAEVFERMAQQANEMSGEDVETHFYSGDETIISHLGGKTSEAFQHAYLCERDRLTVDQLKAYVRAAEAKAGEKIRLLVIDYLGRMRGAGRDQYSKMSELALGVKEVAKECELAVIVICQVNRSGGKGSKEVTLDMARDSGQIEEAADYAVGMWRANGEEEGSEGYVTPDGRALRDAENYVPVVVQINKNRKGPQGEKVRNAVIFRPAFMTFEDRDWLPPAPSDLTWTQEGELLHGGL